MHNIMYETSCQSRFDARYWMLGAGVKARETLRKRESPKLKKLKRREARGGLDRDPGTPQEGFCDSAREVPSSLEASTYSSKGIILGPATKYTPEKLLPIANPADSQVWRNP